MPISHAGPNDNAFSARQAVNHLGKLINDASPMRCYLALNLLDLLVINCGYPVHLMVAKKDFLNKLVYRFPPQPDVHDESHINSHHCVGSSGQVSLCDNEFAEEMVCGPV